MVNPLRVRVASLGRALALALLAVAAPRAGAQDVAAAGVVVVGHVVAADGTPIAGAVVVTDAGGRAVSDDEGRFSLVLEAGPVAGALRVTAFASGTSGGLSSSVRVDVARGSAALDLGEMTLEPASTCEPGWLPAFGPAPGVSSYHPQFFSKVQAMAVFDDGLGGGPELFVAGSYFNIPGYGSDDSNIARWDGERWSSVGGGMSQLAFVHALAVYDDGSGDGPALYVGGGFDDLLKWNGSTWKSIPASLNGGVSSLQVYDDGSGSKLYVGGGFGAHILSWDGSGWGFVGAGLGGPVLAMTVYDDGRGGGPQLVAGGDFFFAGQLQVRHVARWDGSSWSALGLGVAGGPSATVEALVVHDDGRGNGLELYAGGAFAFAGGQAAENVARWDGAAWSPLGSGVGASVKDFASFDDGSGLGAQLYAAGSFNSAGGESAESVARWDGSAWSPLAGGIGGSAEALAVFDAGDGRGPRLVAAGQFATADSVYVDHVAGWDGSSWSPLGHGFSEDVLAFVVFDEGSGAGPALYVGGEFGGIDGVIANGIARWDGTHWTALGSGTAAPLYSGFFPKVRALAVFDDGGGGGPALYAGGEFKTAGGVLVNRIAKWDGSSWSPLGSGMNDTVTGLVATDDSVQGGAALYAVGDFTQAGGVSAYSLARWDGSSWSSIGLANDPVLALAIFDDGSGGGPALYAGGQFSFLDVPAQHIATWDGSSWSPVGGGLTGGVETAVWTMTVFDDGTGEGPALLVGGDFTLAGSVHSGRVARWDGSTWSGAGIGLSGTVLSLAGYDDGSGPALYAGGKDLNLAGSTSNIAKREGSGWVALGTGMSGWITALASFDDGSGSGPKLFVGGDTLVQPETGDLYLATWGGCAPSSPWKQLGYALPGVDGPPLLAGTGTLEAGTSGSLTLTHAAPSKPAQLFIALAANPTPFKGGFLVPLPVTLSLPLATSAAGTLMLPWAAWPGGLSGLELDFQYAIQDAAAVQGVALSNALRALVP